MDLEAVKTLGIPAAILAWVLLRQDRKIDALKEAIEKAELARVQREGEAALKWADALRRLAVALTELAAVSRIQNREKINDFTGGGA